MFFSKLFKKKKENNNQRSNIKVKVLDKSLLSNKKPPLLKELIAKSDEYLKIVKDGKKDEINAIEARYLAYGIDLIEWAKKNLKLEFTLQEEDIKKLDTIMEVYNEQSKTTTIPDDMKEFLILGLAGVFGIITTHYKKAEWINDVDKENGHKLRLVYEVEDNGEKKKEENIIFIEAKAARMIVNNIDDESFASLYYSLPYENGVIPFKIYDYDEYQIIKKILEKEANSK